MKSKLLFSAALVVAANLAFAAKPTSITYVKEIPVDDKEVYAHYQVKCSNGETKDITAWDNRKLWCQGEGLKDSCDKKQIKAAKEACK